MWYKVRELQSKGLNKTQIGKHLGVDRSTVRRYLQMSREDFARRRNSHRKYTLKLAGYEEYVRGTLEEYPYISADRKSTRLNSSHRHTSRMPSSA